MRSTSRLDMVVHRFNDRIREGLARIAGLGEVKRDAGDRFSGNGPRLATAG